MFDILCFTQNKLFEQYGAEFHAYQGSYNKMHDHQGYWELFIITEGSITHQYHSEFKPQNKNYAQLMRPFDVHSIRQDTSSPCTHVSISFHKNVIKNMFDIIDIELHKKLLDFSGAVCAEIDDLEREFIAEKVKYLATLPEQENNYVASELKFIFFSILQKICSNIFKEKKGYPPLIREAINLMQAEYAGYLTIENICENLGCSHISLLRQFKQYTGKTVISYFTDLKLEKAFTLLVSTNYKVLAICNMVGIDSISYFNKKFKEKYGFIPSSLKRNH